jgi:hypothetical protein
MGSNADLVAHVAECPAGYAPDIIGEPEAVECGACHESHERFSVLAELAKDPANGLEEIRPGLYRARDSFTVPER